MVPGFTVRVSIVCDKAEGEHRDYECAHDSDALGVLPEMHDSSCPWMGGHKPAVAVVTCWPGMAQKLNISCRSMLRFDAGEEKNPPARAFDLPNSGDSSTPTGCARFTLLKMLRVIAEKVSE